jgi:hypothetical protein
VPDQEPGGEGQREVIGALQGMELTCTARRDPDEEDVSWVERLFQSV